MLKNRATGVARFDAAVTWVRHVSPIAGSAGAADYFDIAIISSTVS